MAQKQHSVKIDDDTYSRIEDLRAKTRLPRINIIRRAIDGFDITVQTKKL
jgi:predicted transcriptional regulator